MGKTSVLVEIGELLERGADPYGLVDLDWLAWLRPAADSGATVCDVLTRNLGHVWATFRDAGVRRLVLARAVSEREEAEAIRRALGGAELFVVRLVAPRAVIDARLRARDSGSELADHLASLEPGDAGDATVSTHGQDPAAAAREVLVRAGWTAHSG